MSRDVDIVIVNWNAGLMLRDCVQSVLTSIGDVLGRIIVVDNGSIDRSLEHLPADCRVVTIEAGENLGFARACNRGAALTSARFILFLNPDTRLCPNTLVEVRNFMDSSEGASVGICGIRLIQDDGAIQRHTTDFPNPRNIYRVDSFRTPFDHRISRKVSHVIGAFYFIRQNVFFELSGFDEQFFVYFEDLDLSLRVSRAGWDVYYLASVEAYHKGGGTSDQIKARRLFYSQSSRLHYSRKHFSRGGHLAVLAMTLGIEPLLRLARALRHRSIAGAGETLSAYRMLVGREGPLHARRSC